MFENDTQKTRIKELAEGIVLTEEKIGRLEKAVIADRQALILLMQQSGMSSPGLTNGLNPTIQVNPKITRKSSVKDAELFKYLASIDLADIIKPAVHWSTLQSSLADYIALGHTIPKELFNQFDKTTIRMNGRADFLRELTTKNTKGVSETHG